MTKLFTSIIFLLFFSASTFVFAQDRDKIDFTDIESDEFLMFSNKDKALFEDAIGQIKDYEYLNALTILEGLQKTYPEHIYLKYLLSICETYDS